MSMTNGIRSCLKDYFLLFLFDACMYVCGIFPDTKYFAEKINVLHKGVIRSAGQTTITHSRQQFHANQYEIQYWQGTGNLKNDRQYNKIKRTSK